MSLHIMLISLVSHGDFINYYYCHYYYYGLLKVQPYVQHIPPQPCEEWATSTLIKTANRELAPAH